MNIPSVYFAHGKESGPDGAKILRLAEIARQEGFATHSPDYRSTFDPDERVKMLLDLHPPAPLVLVGSSMGAYVATVASRQLRPIGLFLLAPAFYLSGYQEQEPTPTASLVEVVHGWEDEVVPVDKAIAFSQKHGVALHLLPGDHRLMEVLDPIETLFRAFLKKVKIE